MLYLKRWPQLAAMLKNDKTPYILPAPHQVEKECALGERKLCGQDLLAARLDMALAGLMAEFGPDYFCDDIFPSRCDAVEEILAAARVFLAAPLPEHRRQVERVRLLAAEAEAVLMQWNQLLTQKEGQPILFAAEEPAELT